MSFLKKIEGAMINLPPQKELTPHNVEMMLKLCAQWLNKWGGYEDAVTDLEKLASIIRDDEYLH